MDVTGLAQHILNLEPAKHPARLSFYHFLKNLCEPGEKVTPELLNRFYARALSFQHWQQNKPELFTEVRSALLSYASHSPESTAESMVELDKAWTPGDIQTVAVESQSNWVAFIARYLEDRMTGLDQYRVLPEGKDRAVCVHLTQERNIKVTVYPPTAALIGGELVPLCTDYSLQYGPDLQLVSGKLHQIDVGGHTVARFRMREDGCHGVLIRGYTFQRYAAINGGNLHRHPILFYPVKRLEQFFINRKTDPMYVELTGILEKAVELLSQGHPDAMKFGKQALERGQFALEQLFPEDKLVRLLINNLEKTLALEATQNGPRDENQTEDSATPLGSAGQASELSWVKNHPLNV